MSGMRRAILVLAVVALAAPAFGQLAIGVDDPIISSPDRRFGEYLDPQLVQAYAGAEADLTRLLGERVTIGGRGRRDLSMSVIVTDSPQYSALVLQMSNLRTGAVAQPFSYSSGWDDNMHRTLSRAIVSLVMTVSEIPASRAPAPVLLSELDTKLISTKDLGYDVSVMPYGLATDSQGDILLAANGSVVRLDRFLAVRGKLLPPSGADQYSWAGRVAVSPSDMIYTQSITGGDLWEFSPHLTEGRRIRTSGAGVASMAVMEDGSVILHDQVSQETVRIRDDRRQELSLTSGQYSYVRAVAGGPDNTIWTWDITTRVATISDPGGRLIDVVMPTIDATEAAYIGAIAPYPNGDLLLASQNALYRVDQDGLPVWTFNIADHPRVGTLLGLSAIAFDQSTGLIYIGDQLQGRIFQILDVAWANDHGPMNGEISALMEIARRLERDETDADAAADRARFYEERGSWEAAYHNWDLAVYYDPGNVDAEAGIQRVDVARQQQLAREMAATAREILTTVGRASAQTDYMNALAVYEQLLVADPDNWDAMDEMDALIDDFEQPMRPRQRNRTPLTIVSMEIEDIFPSLSLYYATNPIGTVVLRNDLDQSATDIEVTLAMSVMDFPARSETVEELAPGEEVSVPVFARLAERTLSQRGRLLVQPQISIEYAVDGTDLSMDEATEIYAHGNTAITWDDSRKLAAFIMPTERIASDFASRHADVGDRAEEIDVSERLFRAARLAEIVGSLGITYVEDPLGGISEILGQTSVVDTVRYPRDTLRVEAGDCDDTTALLCTLYEATGIRTAIMTSPGHVFMAFNTGEPIQNSWMFESDTTAVVEHAGTVWLPIETTILSEGFTAAWEEGSRLLNRYEPSGEIEFLPVQDARELYEPIPTGDVGFDIDDLDDPIAAGADARYEESIGSIVDVLYERTVADLERRVGGLSNRQKVRALNQIGVLHARFSQPRSAERSFNDAIDVDPDYTASYLNLANLRIMTGRPRDAVGLLGEVTNRRPDSVLANLLLAQANQLMGNQEAAGEFMAIVEEQAPQLASQYPHLTGNGVGRASEAQASPVLPWPVDEE